MVTVHPLKQATLLIAILLLALALRLAPWGDNRFLEDEALYAYWGLQIATGADPMLDLEPVDKPPLHPYVLALGYRLLGHPSSVVGATGALESAARLPSLLASVTGVALVYALGRELYGDRRVGLLAALLLALSPLDILFASTAFTDPLMTALIFGALLAAARGRMGTAGVLAALAAATKQQALFFLPLVIAVGWLSPNRAPQHARPERHAQSIPLLAGAVRVWRQPWIRFVLGFALVALGALWWDLARLQRPGFLEQSLISYGGLGPAGRASLAARAVDWLKLAGGFWASAGFNLLLVGALVAWPAGSLAGWWPGWSRMDIVLGGFALAFLVLHWLGGFQVWDRYMLGLVPLAALLAARALVIIGSAIRAPRWRIAYAAGLGLALVMTLAGPLWRAARSELPFGGDHGAYDGIDALATYMDTRTLPGSVLYHYWLGYHYRFYLFGAPLRLHWYPDLEDLSHDATVYRREPRYIAFPSWRDHAPAEAALASVGISLEPEFETRRRDGTTSFRLYRLVGPAQ
jgi:4-amino-4-deoxy-L-arabinose transferase-like glycosyltransferase